MGLADEFKERDKQLILCCGFEISFGFTQLQCRLAVLDFEGELDRIEIRSDAGLTTQCSLKSPGHPAGEAVADLFCYDLSGSRLPALPWAPLIATRTTKAALVDQLQRPDLRITAVRLIVHTRGGA